MTHWFDRFATRTTKWLGSLMALGIAFGAIMGGVLGGFFWGFTDTYQLVINTVTTIVTFLMVFVVQHSQNRDGIAIQLKLDELLRAVSQADNRFINIEELSEDELSRLSARVRHR